MRILVFGGTGAIGVSVVEQLADSGDEIFVTTRNIREEKKENIHYVVGNAHDESFLRKLSHDKYDAIIDFMHYSSEEFKQKVDFILGLSEHYLFLSSCRVFADTHEKINEESDKLLDVVHDDVFLDSDDYAIAKARNENMLRTHKHANWTIVRPYITYNENRLELGVISKEHWLYRALHGRSIVIPKIMMEKKTVLTSSEDVARIIVAIVHNHLGFGESVNVTCGSSIIWKQILDVYVQLISKKIGYEPKITLVDDPVQYSRSVNCFYKYKYDRAYDREFDNRKLLSMVGDLNFINYNDGLFFCLSKFFDNLSFKNIDWRIEAELDKLSDERTSMLEIKGYKEKIKYLSHRFTPLKI